MVKIKFIVYTFHTDKKPSISTMEKPAIAMWFLACFRNILRTYKAIYGHAPGYLTDLIAIKEQLRYCLHSASGLILKYPSLKLKKTLGDRVFSSAAPNLWNSLPLHIRLLDNFERFKSLLKTHLFRLAFDM